MQGISRAHVVLHGVDGRRRQLGLMPASPRHRTPGATTRHSGGNLLTGVMRAAVTRCRPRKK
jgi:hypothetical protein